MFKVYGFGYNGYTRFEKFPAKRTARFQSADFMDDPQVILMQVAYAPDLDLPDEDEVVVDAIRKFSGEWEIRVDKLDEV